MNISCNKTGCDHNTGFDNTCMFGITKDLIERARSGEPMCEHLRTQVLALVDDDKK